MADDGSSTLKWSGNLDISQASAVHKELMDALDLALPIELNAKDVERVDTSMVQLFSVFFKQARELGIDVKWKSSSEPLQKIARALDLESAIGLAEASSAQQGS